MGTLRWRRQASRAITIPPRRAKKAQYRDRDVGGLQEGWASPYLNRAPGHGGRRAATTFLFGRVRQGDGIRQLDERTMNIGRGRSNDQWTQISSSSPISPLISYKLRLLFFWVVVDALLIADTELNAFAAPRKSPCGSCPLPIGRNTCVRRGS